MAIQDLVNFITEKFENKEYVGATFCDLSKAFDCVSPDILVNKLELYGIRSTSLKLLNSYLIDRTQVVSYNGQVSKMAKLDYGVPQGSVLGPLLFLFYINDLPMYMVNDKTTLYADDTTLSNSSKDLDTLTNTMHETQLKATGWFNSNKLKINSEKNQRLVFSTNHSQSINSGDTAIFLGVTLDSHLTWEPHINNMAKKLCKVIFLLQNIRKEVSMEVVKITYYSLFQSIVTYAILAWGHSGHTKRIFALQRRAIRVLAGIGYRDDVRLYFSTNKILTLPSLYILHCIDHVIKNYCDYKVHADIHSHDTRNKTKLTLNFTRLQKCRWAGNYYAVKFFNKLPDKMTALPQKKLLAVIKETLSAKAYYAIDEFLEDSFNPDNKC